MRSPYFPARSVLFRKEANGVTYRVPALLFLPRSNSFLAFCEERLSPSDSEAHLLVLRRGTFYRNYVEWEDLRVLGTAHLPGHRSMNPCPVYDEFTGTLFLLFIAVLGHVSESFQLVSGKNVTRLCCVSSTDGGATWGPATDLTQAVIGDTIKEWATFALGPGHGIQLKSGRLLVPAYAYQIDCRRCLSQLCQTTPRSFCFHSDTHGSSWRLGEAVPGPDSVECQVVSVDAEDGGSLLYCNARSPLGCRVQALSLDRGAAFQPGQLVPRLVEPRNGCHGSVVGFPAPVHLCRPPGGSPAPPPRPSRSRHWTSCSLRPGGDADGPPGREPGQSPGNFLPPTWVVYSHPTWPDARRDLGVYLSPFPRDPDSWAGPWVIYEGPSAYSDLAYLELAPSPGPPSPAAPPAMAFACLFESGTRTAYDEISFCLFTLYELIDHLPGRWAAPRPGPPDAGRPHGPLAAPRPGQSRGRHGDGGVAAGGRTLALRKKDKRSGMCTVC
ncbi:sialidase-4 [Gadus morhua]|uniref:sialidase-4 n=1 Tax=Gadus morhua TaxID=8049 RepID=UPI0011B557A2|nr:sialidase-4 [Gadus morhua]